MSTTQVEIDARDQTLNHLIETVKDGQSGYEAAARDCTNSDLKHMFSQISRERGGFAVKLTALLNPQRQQDAPDGTLTAALHRGWIHLKSSMATREDLAVLEECERGEAYAVDQYREALLSPSLGTAKEIVEQQSTLVLKAQQRMKTYREKFHAKPIGQ